MFESDIVDDGSKVTPTPGIARRSVSRPLKYGVLLATLLSAKLLAWGVVDRVRETADRIN